MQARDSVSLWSHQQATRMNQASAAFSVREFTVVSSTIGLAWLRLGCQEAEMLAVGAHAAELCTALPALPPQALWHIARCRRRCMHTPAAAPCTPSSCAS